MTPTLTPSNTHIHIALYCCFKTSYLLFKLLISFVVTNVTVDLLPIFLRIIYKKNVVIKRELDTNNYIKN